MGPKLLYSLPALVLALLALALAVIGLSRSGGPDKTAATQAGVVKQQAAAQHRYWVVTRAASEGDQLSTTDLTVVSSTTSIPDAISADQKVDGKPLQRRVRPGELLTQSLFEPDSHLSHVLPTGQRAMAIPVDDVSGAGDLLRPGDHVDVISAFHQSPDNKGPAILAVLRDVPVLAVHGLMEGQIPGKNENDRNRNNTVVLSVSEQQAPRLLMASTDGKIRLAIRANQGDASGTAHDAAENPASTPLYFDDLFPKAEKKAVQHAAPRSRGHRVEVFEGAETRSTYVR